MARQPVERISMNLRNAAFVYVKVGGDFTHGESLHIVHADNLLEPGGQFPDCVLDQLARFTPRPQDLWTRLNGYPRGFGPIPFLDRDHRRGRERGGVQSLPLAFELRQAQA